MSLAETTPDERLSLEIPPDPAHILTARLFAGGVARSLELDDEVADVLQLALTEICSEAIGRGAGRRIVIDVLPDSDPIRVTIVAGGVGGDQTSRPPIEATFRRTLIEALVPGVTFDEQEDRLTVVFTL